MANQELTHRVNNMDINDSTSKGNLINQITSKTNRLLFSKIQELKKGMTKNDENFKAAIRTILGIPTPFECSTIDTHIFSPFVDMIASVEK